MKRWLALTSLAVLASCKFGGPSANPYEYVASDAGQDATLEGGHSQGDEAAVVLDDSGGGPATADIPDAGTPDEEAHMPCTIAAPDAGCDPVHNKGCIAPLQCDVSVSLSGTPTGACVLYTGSEAGGPCTTLFGEPCPPGNTCANSACRALCYCNSDCPTGQCCSDRSGAQGFTFCAPCM